MIDATVETNQPAYTEVFVHREPELIPLRGLRFDNGRLEQLFLQIEFNGNKRVIKEVWIEIKTFLKAR